MPRTSLTWAEVAGPPSVRGALETLGADRLRHGIRAVEDPGLLREIASRRIVLDVCPISNLRTRAVSSLEEHPLPQLVAAGAVCSFSTDDKQPEDLQHEGHIDHSVRRAIAAGLDPMLALQMASLNTARAWRNSQRSTWCVRPPWKRSPIISVSAPRWSTTKRTSLTMESVLWMVRAARAPSLAKPGLFPST